MIVQKLEKINEEITKEDRAFLQVAIPDLEKLFHFIAKAQWIVGFYQSWKNEKNTNKDSYSLYDNSHLM